MTVNSGIFLEDSHRVGLAEENEREGGKDQDCDDGEHDGRALDVILGGPVSVLPNNVSGFSAL